MRSVKFNLVECGIIAFCAFLIAYLTTILIVRWDTVNALLYESSLVRYEVMSAQRGPVTYLVFHSDFSTLESLAASEPEILGVEQHAGSNVAKMAFISANSLLIERVNTLPEVSEMLERNVAMLCH